MKGAELPLPAYSSTQSLQAERDRDMILCSCKGDRLKYLTFWDHTNCRESTTYKTVTGNSNISNCKISHHIATQTATNSNEQSSEYVGLAL